MSWNVYLTNVDPEAVEKAARDGYATFKAGYHDDGSVFGAMDEQFEAALNMARIAWLRKVVGDGNINVTLSGHANPGHKPRQGWANDLVTVSVSSAVRAEAPAETSG